MELDNTDIDRKELFMQKEKNLLNQLNDIKNKIDIMKIYLLKIRDYLNNLNLLMIISINLEK